MGYGVCVFWGFLATKTRTRIDIEIWLDRGMAENQSEKSARIQSRRDALLCFCDDAGPENAGINHRDFRLAVWERPDLSFGDLCGALNVGTKCTACMLNVESAYFDAYKSRPANFVAALETVAARHPTRPNGGPRSVKETLYSVVDGMVPLQPRIAMQIFPVIAARNLRTVLTMSNQFPAAIGARSAQFDCRIEIRDDQGTLVESSTFGLASGENIDIDFSAPLAAKRGKSEIVSGGCWVYQKPTARGSVGRTRPHFKLVGRRGVSAVHTQVTNSAIGSHLLSRANSSERHFIHMTNPNNQPMSSGTTVAPLSGPGEKTITTTLPPKGSALIELPQLELSTAGPLYRMINKSERRRRAHLLISDSELTLMSADHF